MGYQYSSVATATELSEAVSSSATVMKVGSVAGFPSPPFTLLIDVNTPSEEIVTCTAVSALNLTVVRGEDGSPAVGHLVGAVVRHGIVARDIRQSVDHIEAAAGVHGLAPGASVVGSTTTQVLTNKTLSGAQNTFTSLPGGQINPGTVAGPQIAVGAVTRAKLDASLAAKSDVVLADTDSGYVRNPADTRRVGIAPDGSLQYGEPAGTASVRFDTSGVLTHGTVPFGSVTGGVTVVEAAPGVAAGGFTGVHYAWNVSDSGLGNQHVVHTRGGRTTVETYLRLRLTDGSIAVDSTGLIERYPDGGMIRGFVAAAGKRPLSTLTFPFTYRTTGGGVRSGVARMGTDGVVELITGTPGDPIIGYTTAGLYSVMAWIPPYTVA